MAKIFMRNNEVSLRNPTKSHIYAQYGKYGICLLVLYKKYSIIKVVSLAIEAMNMIICA